MKLMKKMLTVMFLTIISSTLVSVGGATHISAAENENVEIISVGVRQDFAPISFINDDGELEGFSYELLVEVDNLLPQYEFDYKPSEFSTMLTSLDSGHVRLVESLLESNEEREEKYLYGKEPYFIYEGYIYNLKENNFEPNSLPELAGHTVQGVIGQNSVAMINQYNELTDGELIETVTTKDSDVDVAIRQLQTGDYEAAFTSIFRINQVKETRGDIFFVSEHPAYANPTFMLFSKEDVELQEAVDSAIKELKENGKIDELIEKYEIAPEGKTLEDMFESYEKINEINFGDL